MGVSLLIRNVLVFNSYLKRFRPGQVAIRGGNFCYISLDPDEKIQAESILDADGCYMIPGLIDIHMHIESSMLSPAAYGQCAAKNGITTIVSEPHEIANVKGIRGVEAMIHGAENALIDILYGIPSSVPSTNATLETTGGEIFAEDMKRLLNHKRVVCVGEIMNYRGVLEENDLEITKFLQYLKKERPGFVIEGHCPSLVGQDLAKYLELGIDSDHTEHTLAEFRQRVENGMFMELQSKMILPEIIEYIVRENVFEHCGFVTDDTMADRLAQAGGLNAVVDKAVRAGFPLEEAIYCATYTNARRMHLYDRGVIAPGKLADFLLYRSFDGFHPSAVYKSGVCIYEENRAENPAGVSGPVFPPDFYQTVHVPEVTAEDFRIAVPDNLSSAEVRAITVNPVRTQTTEIRLSLPVKDGFLDWMQSNCALAAVIERHGNTGGIAFGLVAGTGLHSGAIATTYFHDHHNLFVLGRDPKDMALAVNRLRKTQGGILTAKSGKITAELPLPVCGLLSEDCASEVGKKLSAVRSSMYELGYRHDSPIMSLCTLGLPVSPALKLTDKGLVDVRSGKTVPLLIPAG